MTKSLRGKQAWIFGAVFLIGMPAAAFWGNYTVFPGPTVGGAVAVDVPNTVASETCFPSTIDSAPISDGSNITEVRVNPRGVLQDGVANTFLRCHISGISGTTPTKTQCVAGYDNGKVAYCNQVGGPTTLPDLDDRVYMTIDTAAPDPSKNCTIVVQKSYGEALPQCRNSSGTPGTCFAPEWQSNLPYVQGHHVTRNSVVYTAMWWTTEDPSIVNGQDKAWRVGCL